MYSFHHPILVCFVCHSLRSNKEVELLNIIFYSSKPSKSMLHRAITDHYKKLKSLSRRDSTIPLTQKNVAKQIKRDKETYDLVESIKSGSESNSGSNASEVRNGKDLIVRLKKTIIGMRLDAIDEELSNLKSETETTANDPIA